MAPKRVTRKRPAAGADEPFGALRPGFLLDDLSALRQRADLAAKDAAARYPTPTGVSIICTCIGQPRIEGASSPYPEEIEPNANYWKPPRWTTRIRLAFRWEIYEGGAFAATESGSCVLSLNKAEQHGVPLPTGWGPKVAALLDGSLQTKGTLMFGTHLARASGALFVNHVLVS